MLILHEHSGPRSVSDLCDRKPRVSERRGGTNVNMKTKTGWHMHTCGEQNASFLCGFCHDSHYRLEMSPKDVQIELCALGSLCVR